MDQCGKKGANPKNMNPVKKILILAANPKTTPRLRLDEEVREIREGLMRAKRREQFEIHQNWAVRLRDLRRALLDVEPQIVHFTGQGKKGGILVEDELGMAVSISPGALSGLFKLFENQVECILLNACYSESQAKAISRHIDYVIGMREEIDDKAAIQFAVGFYDALGAGKPIEEAFKFGCSAIQLYNIPGHLVPLLLEKKRVELPGGEKIEEQVDPGGKSGALLKRTQKELTPNPFTTSLAIREPARFIGRQAEMRRLLTLLQNSSAALQGEPKIGKSSLLFQIARKWKGQIIGPINCLELDGHEDFYERIAEALELDKSDWRTLRSALYDRSILLLIDELDAAPRRGLDQDALNCFRPLCENTTGFKMVAVSRNPLKKIFPDTGWESPFYNLLQPLTLGPLNRDDALLLLSHPWAPEAPTFDELTVDRLLKLSECHPFRLQKAAYHCYEALADPSYDWEAKFQHDVEHLS